MLWIVLVHEAGCVGGQSRQRTKQPQGHGLPLTAARAQQLTAHGRLTGHRPGHGGCMVAVVHQPLGNVLRLDAGGVGDGAVGGGERDREGRG